MNQIQEKTLYNILIVSDIHDNLENTKKLVELYKDKQIDFIFDCGDTVDVPIGKQTDKQTCEIYFEKLKQIHTELSKIAPIFWVPGNHEPYYFFDFPSPQITPKTENLHKKFKKITKNLYIVGLGGGIAILDGGKYDENFILFKTLDKKNFKYKGYPYNAEPDDYEKTDEIFGKDLEEVIKKAKEDGGEDINIILLSHLGPLYTTTNYVVLKDDIMYLGSEILGKVLQNEKKMFLNVHGHSHSAEGVETLAVGNKMVINPGAHQDGHYARVEIRKNNDGNWGVREATIGYL